MPKIPKRIKIFLFDMDDVLVLTRALDKKVKQEIFAELGLSWDQIFPSNHLAMKELVPKLFKDFGIERQNKEFIERYFLTYNQFLAEDLEKNQVPGIKELVKGLVARNYQLALVTSSTKEQATIVARGLGIFDCFKVFITANDITYSKPHPEPYQKAILALGARPEECAVVEDLPTGIQSAKNASQDIFVVGITTTNSKEKLQQADLVIDSFKELEFE
jgi:HAD superfamily hydrolase (TIGR01509 family)